MYLFETYIHNEAEMRVDQDKLTRDLTDAGFEREDIYNALMWLEKLADYQEGLVEPMQLASDPLSFGYIPKRSASVWMPVAGDFTLPRADSGVEPRNARNGDRARTGAGYGRI
jgi:hypothetical protein